MKKKYYLEAVRITAVLLVMYNHSAPFMSFATQHGVQYAVSFFLSLVCKAAVPLFYMVSGALLLGKNESFGELARKRILRIVAVIVIFSLLYYLKFAVRGQASVSPIRFCLDCRLMWRFCHTGISIVILEFLSVFLFCARWHRICRKMHSGI